MRGKLQGSLSRESFTRVLREDAIDGGRRDWAAIHSAGRVPEGDDRGDGESTLAGGSGPMIPLNGEMGKRASEGGARKSCQGIPVLREKLSSFRALTAISLTTLTCTLRGSGLGCSPTRFGTPGQAGARFTPFPKPRKGTRKVDLKPSAVIQYISWGDSVQGPKPCRGDELC